MPRDRTTFGDLRERILVERFAATDDGAGGATREWAPLFSRRASVVPTGGREALINGGLTAVAGFRITVAFDRDTRTIVAQDRLRWRDMAMNVHSAADPDATRRWLVIFADSGVVTA